MELTTEQLALIEKYRAEYEERRQVRLREWRVERARHRGAGGIIPDGTGGDNHDCADCLGD